MQYCGLVKSSSRFEKYNRIIEDEQKERGEVDE